MSALCLFLLSSALAEPSFQQLHSARAEASSYLKSNWNKYSENYHPNYILDDNPATAWVEGADGQGQGEVLSWDVSALSSARAVRVRIRNGYQKSPGLFAANSVPKDVRLQVWRGAHVVAEQTVTLEKAMGWQDVVVSTNGQGIDHVELKVLSVYPGSKYKDTCISDIETWVDSDVPYNAAFERSQHARLEAWIAERVETAQYFANLPATYPFASTRFERTSNDIDEAIVMAAIEPLRAAHDAMGGDGPWFSAAFVGTAPVLPDGLWEIREVAPYLRSDSYSLFETNSKQGKYERFGEDRDIEEAQWTNYEVERKDGRVHRVRFALTRTLHGRGTSVDRYSFLLEYGEDQRLESVYVRFENHEDDLFHTRGEQHLTLQWNAGQLTQVVKLVAGIRDVPEGFGANPGSHPYSFREVFTPAP